MDATAVAAKDAAAEGNAPDSAACATADDCFDLTQTSRISANQPAAYCCVHGTCLYGQAATDGVSRTNANVQLIVASNYAQSCQADSDCVAVAEGNFCFPGAGNCANAAIYKSASSQYQTDIAKTNAAICRIGSSCRGGFGPCCRSGLCQWGSQCSESASPTVGEVGVEWGDGNPE